MERVALRLRLPAYVLGTVAVVFFIGILVIPDRDLDFIASGWLTLGLMWAGGLWTFWRLNYPTRVAANDATERWESPTGRGRPALKVFVFSFYAIWFVALVWFTWWFYAKFGS